MPNEELSDEYLLDQLQKENDKLDQIGHNLQSLLISSLRKDSSASNKTTRRI